MDVLLTSISTILAWITHPFKSSSTTSNSEFTFLLHSTPFIYYRGTHTYVAFSLLTNGSQTSIDPKDMKVELIQRGWRAGLFGWNLAGYLGANTKSGLDITPTQFKSWEQAGDGRDDVSTIDSKNSIEMDSLDKNGSGSSASSSIKAPTLSLSQTKRYDSQIQNATSSKKSSIIGTSLVRIPVSSGDGYFRLSLKHSSSSKIIINSPTLRIFSFSLSSASPRGSSILPPTLVPELVLRTVSTIIYSALLGLFPVVALFEKVSQEARSPSTGLCSCRTHTCFSRCLF